MSAELVDAGLAADEARRLTDQIKVAVEGVWHLVTRAYEGRAWVALGYSSWDDYCTREFGASRIRLPREERQEIVGSLRDAGLSIRAIAAATGAGRDTVHRELSTVRNRTVEVEDAAGVPDGTPDSSGDSYGAAVETLMDLGMSAKDAVLAVEMADVPEADFEAALGAARNDGDMTIGNVAKHLAQDVPATCITGINGKTYQPNQPTPKQRNRPALPPQVERAALELRKAVERMERLFGDDRFTANKTQVAAFSRGHLTYTVEVCQDLLDQLDPRKDHS